MKIDDVNSVNRSTYDELADEYEQRVAKRLAGNLDRITYFTTYITSGKKVLDIGCAVGLDIMLFNQLGYKADGIEISPKMAAYAQKRNPTAKIMVGDFLALSIEDKYDAVFARAFIHVFPKSIAEQIMMKIFNILVDGGAAFFGVSTTDKPWEGWLEKDDYQNTPERYKKLWAEEELRESLAKVGFDIIDVIKPVDAEGKLRLAITVRKPKQSV